MQTKMKRADIVAALEKRDGLSCRFPGCDIPFSDTNPPTIDHWFPQSLGGTWDLENLRLMHKSCNTKKGDRIPNPDGTIPAETKNKTISRAMKRSERPVVCETCLSGRLLGPDEECDRCGSGPMPPRYPQWSKLKPNECDHSGIWWCWCCMSGVVDRVPASEIVFDGQEPGID